MGICFGKSPQKEEVKNTQDILFETIFEFKNQANQLSKESKKADKEKELMVEKIKQAFSKNKPDEARLYAENVFKKKNAAIKYELLSLKLLAVHSKLKDAYQAQKLSDNIQSMVTKMSGALNNMNLEKISETMMNFEKIFDNLDVNTKVMEKALDNIDTGSYEDQDVNTLIVQIAQAQNIELSSNFDEIKKNHDPSKIYAIGEKMKVKS